MSWYAIVLQQSVYTVVEALLSLQNFVPLSITEQRKPRMSSSPFTNFRSKPKTRRMTMTDTSIAAIPGRLSSIFRRGAKGAGEEADVKGGAMKEPVAKDDVLEVMRQLEQQNDAAYAQAEQFLAAANAKDGVGVKGVAGGSPSQYLTEIR